MSSADSILPRLVDEQAHASDPSSHVWLAASAGTGKTQVLAARVYRLLLGGTDPGAILCLTFTKAGAAEMAGRINQRLARWVRASEADIRADLASLGERATPALIARARTLFAKVLDAPGGGLRIQTIHGFCQSLLAAFPVEAGLTPGFRPLEAREESALARETLAQLLVDAEREGRDGAVRAVGALSLRLGEEGAEAFLRACARAPAAMAALPMGEGVGPYVRRALIGVDDVEAAIAAGCDELDDDLLEHLRELNQAWGTKNGLARADIIATWLARNAEQRTATLGELHSVWARQDGELRSFAKGQAPQDEDYAPIATDFHEQVSRLIQMRHLANYADLLAAGLAVGRDYAFAYRAAKRRIGAVDFDDLIDAAVALLRQDGMGDWVRFKLDQATDHVLIDEAQDTNLRQWEIVDAIASDFFSGLGSRGDRRRTLFTVGDYKQAIFGFQGTDPLNFRWAERHFRDLAEVTSDISEIEPTPFEQLALTSSFRSTQPILDFIDAAIGVLPGGGLGVDDNQRHSSKVEGPGQVNLWAPTLAGEEDEGEEGWVADAVRAHATRIAAQVKAWLDPNDPLILESKGRPLRPEDVMILVKRRGELASLIVARLYAEGVAVAGVDRLRLTAPLAVQDLLAAIRFVLQPQDDLALASLLVSPLIGWTQDELMHAAMKRRGGLWAHLQATQSAERIAPLAAMLRRADFTTPYVFLEEMLTGALDGRRKLIRRLGQEARDPIDELLNAALEFERVAIPSLQRFLDWFDRGDVEIVRDPSQPLDAVRVMTAHGAKGLQAPLVILADATADPEARPRSTLDWQADQDTKLPVFRPRKEQRSGALAEAIATADARELAEHWRLFYVAATRAEERLEIAGSLGPRSKGVPSTNSWYAAAEAALTALGAAERESEGPRRSFAGHDPQPPVRARPSRVAETRSVALPDWAFLPAPIEARPPRPLAPSSVGEDDVSDPPPSVAMRTAAERGRLIHALFERLPALAPDRRTAAAERWLANVGQVADAAIRSDLISTVLAVLDDPAHGDLFGANSLGEAPISAVVPGGYVIAGTVDRLLVEPDRVRVIDFKTGRRVPLGLDEVPVFHLRQMAAYAEALRVIFPGRRIEAALLYTAAPRLFDLPDDVLAGHKPGFVITEQS
nr:double-strand break repair helicase AddA [Sphingomonas asaccharolytica]